KAMEEKLAYCLNALVEVDGTEQGFKGGGEDTFAATAMPFAFAHAHVVAQLNVAGKVGQSLCSDEDGADVGQFAFAKVRKGAIEKIGTDEGEDGVAKKFQAFVGQLSFAWGFVNK